MRRSTAPLREREFRLLFTGRTISLVGSAIAPVALAFAVLDLTGSKTDLGLILFCREVPLVVFLLVGGIWADRIPRNKVMVSANVVSAFAQAVTAALLITGNAEVWHLAALAARERRCVRLLLPRVGGRRPADRPGLAPAAGECAPAAGDEHGDDRRRRNRRLPRRRRRLRLGDRRRRVHLSAGGRLHRRGCGCPGRPRPGDEHCSGARRRLARVPLADVALGDRAPVLVPARGRPRSVQRPRACRRRRGARRREGLGRDPDRPGRRPRRRRAGRAALPPAADAARRDARDPAVAGAAGRTRLPAARAGDRGGRVRRRLRPRGLQPALAHDDAAGDSRRQALARLLLRRARLVRCSSRSGSPPPARSRRWSATARRSGAPPRSPSP